MKRMLHTILLPAILVAYVAVPLTAETLTLQTRRRGEEPAGSGKLSIAYHTVNWDASKTAVLVCDMWAKHWCAGATGRVAQLAPRMNAFLAEARRRGALVIHAPSGGMEYYEDHPARTRAQQAPRANNTPGAIHQWCRQLDVEKGQAWPIDQSDGGCDCDPPCKQSPERMDRRQIAALEICPEDAITDSGVECWNLLEQHGVEHVLMVGVHTNMCVLGRPFGIRNLVRAGKDVLLVRDLTDAMYNPARSPYVSHDEGTRLVVEYIEKFWCATVASDDLPGRGQ